MKKRVWSFVSVIALMIACLIPTGATEVSEASSRYLNQYGAWLTADGDGVISVCVDVQAVTYMDEVGASVIEVYESADNGVTWNIKRTYLKSLYPQMVVEDDLWYYDVAIEHQGTAGYKYFAIVTAYAADSTGFDEKDYQTASITAT